MNYNLILHIDSAEESALRLVLRNANNYLNALAEQSFELVIVANGPAVKQFTHENKTYFATAQELADKGVKFRMCANALRENGIGKEQLWPFCVIVAAGLVEIVRLQREDYAYVKP